VPTAGWPRADVTGTSAGDVLLTVRGYGADSTGVGVGVRKVWGRGRFKAVGTVARGGGLGGPRGGCAGETKAAAHRYRKPPPEDVASGECDDGSVAGGLHRGRAGRGRRVGRWNAGGGTGAGWHRRRADAQRSGRDDRWPRTTRRGLGDPSIGGRLTAGAILIRRRRSIWIFALGTRGVG